MTASTLPVADMTTEERLAAMADAGHPPNWMPYVEGSTHPKQITGVVVEYTQGYTKAGDLENILILDLLSKPGTRVSVWLFHTTLKNRILDEIRPVIGETVFIRWDGLQKPKTEGGSDYHGWTVVVDRTNPENARYPWDLPSSQVPTNPDPRTQADAMVPFGGEPASPSQAAAATEQAETGFPTDDIPF